MNEKNLIIDSLCEYLQRYHKGANEAVSSKELEAVFHLKGTELRHIINTLRCNGTPICSDRNGYYYADTDYDIKHTISQLNSRIVKMSKAKKGLCSSLEEKPNE